MMIIFPEILTPLALLELFPINFLILMAIYILVCIYKTHTIHSSCGPYASLH